MSTRDPSRAMGTEAYPTRESAESTAAQFIARRDQGPWTASEAAALQSWLAESVSHRAAYYRLNAAWYEVGRLKALRATKVDLSEVADDEPAPIQAVGTASQTMPPERVQEPSRRRGWAVLAASLVLAALGFASWSGFSDLQNRYATPVGATETLPLADGSRILLNTNSAVRVSLRSHERMINLERGEAYFEVAHDPTRPFVVQVGSERVIAVGTQFAVRRDDENLRVSVTEGTVRLERQGAESTDRSPGSGPGTAASKELLLPAGTVARVESQDVLVQKQPMSELEQSLSWRTGVLTFRDTPLAEAVAEFNRYNSRQIVIDDPSIATLQVGGMFRANNIEAFVHLIEQGFPIQAADQGEKITLTARH